MRSATGRLASGAGGATGGGAWANQCVGDHEAGGVQLGPTVQPPSAASATPLHSSATVEFLRRIHALLGPLQALALWPCDGPGRHTGGSNPCPDR